jgi:hypothetical protein
MTKRRLTALIPTHQLPLIECSSGPPDEWRIWLSYDRDKTAGTYLSLCPKGMILHCTQLPTGEVVNVKTITPEERD